MFVTTIGNFFIMSCFSIYLLCFVMCFNCFLEKTKCDTFFENRWKVRYKRKKQSHLNSWFDTNLFWYYFVLYRTLMWPQKENLRAILKQQEVKQYKETASGVQSKFNRQNRAVWVVGRNCGVAYWYVCGKIGLVLYALAFAVL